MKKHLLNQGECSNTAKAIRWILLPASLAIGGCVCTPPEPFTDCVDFESLTVDTRYQFQDSFSDAGVTITVEAFQWGNGNWTNGNYAEVDDLGRAGGSGLEMKFNNVNLRFDFGPSGLNGMTMKIGEYGGNLNMFLNGEFRNFGNFDELDGSTMGGATLAVIGGTGNDTGLVTINGTVQSFAVGGQELWVDDVCAM